MNKLRIAYITYEFPPETGKGGIGTYTFQIAKLLSHKGMDIHVFAGSETKTNSILIDNFTVHYVKCQNTNEFKKEIKSVFEIQHLIKAFDIIESPEINSNAWEVKKHFPSIPLFVRLHAPNYLVESLKKKYTPFLAKLRFFIGALIRFKWDLGYWRNYDFANDFDFQFANIADGLTAPSIVMKNWAQKNWNFSDKQIEVIPNPFFPSCDLVDIPINLTAKAKTIVFFGRLNVLKGLVNCTLAVKKILEEFPDWQFKVIGDDSAGPANDVSMRDWMRIKLNNVIKQVQFLDGVKHENLAIELEKPEIVVLPSLFESFSYTCIEAMVAGKAVIGSKNTGMADLIDNGVSGILINPESNREIYNSIKKLIIDNEFRYNVSLNARNTVLNRLSDNNLADTYLNYYTKIIECNKIALLKLVE